MCHAVNVKLTTKYIIFQNNNAFLQDILLPIADALAKLAV